MFVRACISLTAIGRRSLLPRSVVLHEHHRPEPLTSATTTSRRRRRNSRGKQSTRRPLLQRPINNSLAWASDNASFHGRSPAQSVLSLSDPEQRRQLRGKMLVPKSTQTGIQQRSDIVASSTSAVEKEQGSKNVPDASDIHPDGNIMALFPKRYAFTTLAS